MDRHEYRWETGHAEVDNQHRNLLAVAGGLINFSLTSMESNTWLKDHPVADTGTAGGEAACRHG